MWTNVFFVYVKMSSIHYCFKFIILSQVCGFNVSMKLSYCYLSNFFMDPSIQIDLVETCSAIPLLNLSEVSFNFVFFSRLFLESPLVIVFFLLYPPIYACPCLCVVALISKNWNYVFLHFISVCLWYCSLYSPPICGWT